MARRKFLATLLMAGFVSSVVGCGGGDNKTEEAKGPAQLPAQGPNGGRLVPLGAREYVVEVVHDAAIPIVSFHLLDANAKRRQRVPAFEIVVNTKVNGASTEHKILSQPDKTDSGGQTSRFIATDPKVVDAIMGPGTEVEIVLTYGEKKLTGTIKNEGEPPAPTPTATGPAKPAAKPKATTSGSASPTGSATATPTGSATAAATGTATPSGTGEKK
jgi:hypothetical protein